MKVLDFDRRCPEHDEQARLPLARHYNRGPWMINA